MEYECDSKSYKGFREQRWEVMKENKLDIKTYKTKKIAFFLGR